MRIVEFVRMMRRKKVAIFLKEGNYSIVLATYIVGFNDAKYFSKYCKNQFGKNPLDYKKSL
ncbi:hypothetical protein QQ008_17445 [Fulvivirgaceae bacterium BMA10]|uniref:HTH araC/xylS-type domain-containing protein n=1 Tax=Splendidivirga corallicola TaxID=3051826 RepID=A0ABT8KU69_9BACT|nr:hypothetical protein [Fulvivirgaceae bacterium BMA10]